MKKLYLFALTLGLAHFADAQVLNQSAGWPNAAWTLTGTYNADPVALEASPITTANFAYDDDDAGNSAHEDNIAAESPVVDLTAAFNANERKIFITADYGYYYLADDVLIFQYWDADAAAWVAWPGENIPGNNTTVTNNFCTITKTTYISATLDIANFTATQLSGFKYRIAYDDNPIGTDWNYGFCFNSPTIKSAGCAAPSGLFADGVTSSSANIGWIAIDGAAGYEYVLDNSPADPVSGLPFMGIDFEASDLDPSTVYYFHVRTNCGDSYSEWRTVQFTTGAEIPANDACADAIVITSFPYSHTLDASAATNNNGFITTCTGMNDGVWYTFTGNGGDITVTCENVIGWDPRLAVYTGVCGQFTCVGQEDDLGSGGSETYTVTASAVGTTYYVNIGYYSGFSDNPEGPFTLTISSTLGTPSFSDADFSAYPNPVKNTLNLSYVNEMRDVAVYNLLGQQVLAKPVNANETSVDFTALSQGAYLVKVTSGNASKTIRVIKQ